MWEFIERIVRLGVSCVSPGGKYMTHVTGKSVPHVLDKFLDLVKKITGDTCHVDISEAFVPSFMEVWVFCQITKDH